MRDELAKMNGVRRCFQGTFVKFGLKSGYKGLVTTILLKDVVDVCQGKVVTDHLWFIQGKRFETLDLKEGDVVRFDARVTEYTKGYRGRRYTDENGGYEEWDNPVERDYRLSFPSKLVKVLEGEPRKVNDIEWRNFPTPATRPAQPKILQQNLGAFM